MSMHFAYACQMLERLTFEANAYVIHRHFAYVLHMHVAKCIDNQQNEST